MASPDPSTNATSASGEALDRALAAIQRGRVALDLDTTHLCFLVALRARADRSALASFEEDLLVDVFEQVCEQTEPGAQNPRKRATHAIQRLRDQRLLTRVDASGVVQAGEFALTRLATGIVDFFLAEETLTRESLGLLTRTLLAQLTAIRAAARQARTSEAWAGQVVAPLRVTVGDLLTGIERRQRGMDAQQEEVVEEIEALLRDDWFDAVEACERLLDSTSTTLRELNEVLMQDTTHLIVLLQDIDQLAGKAKVEVAIEAVRTATEHVERVVAWGGARLRTWSGYYQHVHGFLRDVVRLDPQRAVSQRLRDQLTTWLDKPFAFVIATEPSIRLLRSTQAPVDRPAVTRPREDRTITFEEIQPGDDRQVDLEARVRDAVETGARTLSEVLARVLPDLPEAERYRAVGRVADLFAREPLALARVRPWVEATCGIEVEEWTLARKAPEPCA